MSRTLRSYEKRRPAWQYDEEYLTSSQASLLSDLQYKFGPYLLTQEGRLLLRDGAIVTITPKVLAVLSVLVQAAGKPVAKDDLLKAVWPDSFAEDSNLIQNISVLRKLMAQDYPEGSAVETIGRFGYRFRPHVDILHGSVEDWEESRRETNAAARKTSIGGHTAPGPGLGTTQASQIDSLREGPGVIGLTEPTPARGLKARFFAAVVCLLCVVLLAIAAHHRLRSSAATGARNFRSVRFTSNPSNESVTAAAISLDGSSVVFAEPHQLRVRPVQGTGELRIPTLICG